MKTNNNYVRQNLLRYLMLLDNPVILKTIKPPFLSPSKTMHGLLIIVGSEWFLSSTQEIGNSLF